DWGRTTPTFPEVGRGPAPRRSPDRWRRTPRARSYAGASLPASRAAGPPCVVARSRSCLCGSPFTHDDILLLPDAVGPGENAGVAAPRGGGSRPSTLTGRGARPAAALRDTSPASEAAEVPRPERAQGRGVDPCPGIGVRERALRLAHLAQELGLVVEARRDEGARLRVERIASHQPEGPLSLGGDAPVGSEVGEGGEVRVRGAGLAFLQVAQAQVESDGGVARRAGPGALERGRRDRKSTRLNSSHV